MRGLLHQPVVAWDAILVPAITFVVVVGIVYFATTNARIDATISASEHTMRLMIDMETGQRGFLVGGDPDFLQPYLEAQKGLGRSFAILADLIHGNAEAEPHLTNARNLAEQWQALAASQIAKKRAGAGDIGAFDVASGKRLMDKIRAEFESINSIEHRKRPAVFVGAKNSWWLGGASIVALALSLLSSYTLSRLRRTTDRLRRANDGIRAQLDRVEELQELVDRANDAIIIRDYPDSRVRFWNKGAVRLYGYGEAEAKGEVTHTLLGTVFPKTKEETDRCLDEVGSWKGRLEHLHKDGTKVVVQSEQVLTRDHAGDPPKAILEINRDITEEERLLRERDRVIKYASHDLRGPLNLVVQYASEATREENLDDIREDLRVINRAAKSMKLLIDDFLDISAPKVVVEDFPLGDFCEHLESLHSSKTGISYKIDMTNLDPKLILRTDRQKLLRCLSNVLKNAFEYAHTIVTLQITLTADHRLTFAIIDDGDGIPEEERPQVLKTPNWRGKSSLGKSGFGLGLAIAKDYAELLGGGIYYPRSQAFGCRFEVVVPTNFEGRTG